MTEELKEPFWDARSVSIEYACPHCGFNRFEVYANTDFHKQEPEPIYNIVTCKNIDCEKEFRVYTSMTISPYVGAEEE